MVSVIIGSAEQSLVLDTSFKEKNVQNFQKFRIASLTSDSTLSETGFVEAIFQMNTCIKIHKLVLKQFTLDLKFRSHINL